MIDCENEVFTRVADGLRDAFPDVNVTSEYVRAPTSFPHVSVVMADSYSVTEKEDSTFQENLTGVLFEVNAYSNRASGRKAECKHLINLAGDILTRMNFRRIAQTPVPNLEDGSIYRITARFRAATDGKYFYRR